MLVPIVLFFVLVLIFLRYPIFNEKQIPPGPNTIQILKKISELKKNPHIALQNLAKTYGPLMSLRLGGQLVVVVSSSSLAKHVLKTHDSILSGRYLPSILCKVPQASRSMISMAMVCNGTWKFLRGLSHGSIFSPKSIELNANVRNAKVRELVNYLQTKEGEVLDLEDVTNTIIGNILSNVLASRDIFGINGGEDQQNVRELFRESIEMLSALGVADLFPILRKVDFWNKKKGIEIISKTMSVWEDTLKRRRAKLDYNGNETKDYLDVLIENGLQDDDITLALMEILIAGTDTSSITSIWLMIELLRHPGSLRRVREEITNAFKQDDMSVNEQALTESNYLQACIKETLRLHIPGPLLIPHRAINTCKIDNYMIPKDCMVLINGWAIGREPNNWDEAESFKPERFIDVKIDYKGTHFEFIPFGAGRRMCPGMNLAVMNVQLVVASLLHYFDWTLEDGNDASKIDMTEKFGTVLKNEKPIYLVPRRRSYLYD